jgi:hypothetical protein
MKQFISSNDIFSFTFKTYGNMWNIAQKIEENQFLIKTGLKH